MIHAADWTPWTGWNPSSISHHQAECCDSARSWFLAMSRAQWLGRGGPVWIRRDFDWGPCRWPLHWCEAIEAKEFCCGAHAALSIEAFRARGVRAVPAQLVQRYERHNVPHWHERWTECGASPAWATEGLVYHEACAVIADDRVRIWNASASSWSSPESVLGYGSIAAVRIGGPDISGEVVHWGRLELPLGEWVPTAAQPVPS